MEAHSDQRQAPPAPPAPVDALVRQRTPAIPPPRRQAQRAAAETEGEWRTARTAPDTESSSLRVDSHTTTGPPTNLANSFTDTHARVAAQLSDPTVAERADGHVLVSKQSSTGDARHGGRGPRGTPLSPKHRSRDRTGEDRHHSHENLHIRNVPLSMDERTLRAVFSQFGNITSAVIMRNIHTGESQGKAFVRFDTEVEAARAMTALNAAQSSAEAPFTGKGVRRYGGAAGTAQTGHREPSSAATAAAAASAAAALVFTDEKGRRMSAQWARRQHDSAPVGPERKKMRKLFVRNIPISVSADMLEILFKQFGTVNGVSIHHDTQAAMESAPRHPNASATPPVTHRRGASGGASEDERRIAFITYAEEGVAAEAAQQVHNTTPFASCHGVPLMVKLAEDTPLRHGQGTHNNNNTASKTDGPHGTTAMTSANTNTAPVSGFNSLNTTLSQLPSACSPVRMSPAGPFPGQFGLMSLAGLSQDGLAGPAGPAAGGYPVSGLCSTDGSPVLTQTVNSTSSLMGHGFVPGTFSSLTQNNPNNPNNNNNNNNNGSGFGPGLAYGAQSVPFQYLSLNGSPRFGTPAGTVPAIALPSAAPHAAHPGAGSGAWAGLAPQSSAPGLREGPSPPSQAATSSPFHGSLTGAGLGSTTSAGAAGTTTPPMMTTSYNAFVPWSAAGSGAGSPIGSSLFPGGASSPVLLPASGGATGGHTNGPNNNNNGPNNNNSNSNSIGAMPYRLPLPAPLGPSGAAAAAPGLAPHVYIPVPVYPSSSSGANRQPAAAEPRHGGPYSASAPPVPTLVPPSQGHLFTYAPASASTFMDPTAGPSFNSPPHAQPYLAQTFGGLPAPRTRAYVGSGAVASASAAPFVAPHSNRSSEVVSPRDLHTTPTAPTTTASSSTDAVTAFLESLMGPAAGAARLPLPHVPVAPSPPAGSGSSGFSPASGGSSTGRRSRPRKHSSATSDSSNYSGSLAGGGAGGGGGGGLGGSTALPYAAEEASGLTVSQYRNAQLDEALVGTSCTSAERSPSRPTVVGDAVSVTAASGSSDVWTATPTAHRTHEGFKRPTMSLDAVRQGHTMLFNGDFNVFTPVTGSGETRHRAPSPAAAAVADDDNAHAGAGAARASGGGDCAPAARPNAIAAVFTVGRADGVDASETSMEGSSLHRQSSHSFMNEEVLQQLMSQFAAPSEDNEFFQTAGTPSASTGEP